MLLNSFPGASLAVILPFCHIIHQGHAGRLGEVTSKVGSTHRHNHTVVPGTASTHYPAYPEKKRKCSWGPSPTHPPHGHRDPHRVPASHRRWRRQNRPPPGRRHPHGRILQRYNRRRRAAPRNSGRHRRVHDPCHAPCNLARGRGRAPRTGAGRRAAPSLRQGCGAVLCERVPEAEVGFEGLRSEGGWEEAEQLGKGLEAGVPSRHGFEGLDEGDHVVVGSGRRVVAVANRREWGGRGEVCLRGRRGGICGGGRAIKSGSGCKLGKVQAVAAGQLLPC